MKEESQLNQVDLFAELLAGVLIAEILNSQNELQNNGLNSYEKSQ